MIWAPQHDGLGESRHVKCRAKQQRKGRRRTRQQRLGGGRKATVVVLNLQMDFLEQRTRWQQRMLR